jgi:hypothetical protein
MVLIKPQEDWSDEESGFYDGPPPTPGTYRGKVTRMGLSKVKSGENEGADKWVVALEIADGPFKGAGVITSFTMIKKAAWSFNQFLKAMTDGSEKQTALIKKWYYKLGYKLSDEEIKNLGTQIEYIGKPAFKPIGKPVVFVTSMNGEYAQVDRFLVPQEGQGAEEPAPEEDSSDGLGEFAEETTSNPTTEEAVAEEVAAEDDSDDSDDPWS